MKQIKTENNTNLQQLMLILNKNYELSYTYITTLTSLIKNYLTAIVLKCTYEVL